MAIKDTKHNEIVTRGDFNGFFREFPEGRFVIHSVRRLSDGEVFSVGDRFTCSVYYIQKRIKGFIITDSGWLQIQMDDGDTLSHVYGNPLEGLKKLPQPILTTVDGVGLYEGMEFWVVDREITRVLSFTQTAREDDRGKWQSAKIFSTKEAAELFVFDHAVTLSLSDVKEALEAKGQKWRSHAEMRVLLTT